MPAAARSRHGAASAHLPGLGSNPTGGHGCLSLVRVVFCHVEVSASS